MKSLEEENAKLKRLLADAMLDVSTLREMLGKNFDARAEEKCRDLGDRQQGYAQRRACGLIGMEPRVYRYRSTRPGDAGFAQAAAGIGGRAAPLRLPPAAPSAEA